MKIKQQDNLIIKLNHKDAKLFKAVIKSLHDQINAIGFSRLTINTEETGLIKKINQKINAHAKD